MSKIIEAMKVVDILNLNKDLENEISRFENHRVSMKIDEQDANFFNRYTNHICGIDCDYAPYDFVGEAICGVLVMRTGSSDDTKAYSLFENILGVMSECMHNGSFVGCTGDYRGVLGIDSLTTKKELRRQLKKEYANYVKGEIR